MKDFGKKSKLNTQYRDNGTKWRYGVGILNYKGYNTIWEMF